MADATDDKKTNVNEDPSKKGDQNSDSGNQNNGNTQTQEENDVSKLPKWAQDQIKSLRNESAKHRTEKNNAQTQLEKFREQFKKLSGDSQDEVDPEKVIGQLESGFNDLSVKHSILSIAYQNGVKPDQLEFFEFKVMKKLESLGEGQELTEDDINDILKGFQSSGSPANTSTSGGKKPENDGAGKNTVTLEAFVKMGMIEKSNLYMSDKETYDRLMSEAKNKKLI